MDQFLTDLGFSASLVEALHLDTLARLVLAALIGGAIGLEREISGKPAGLRTNLLICVGAALITELSVHIATEANPGQGGFRADPARLAAQIVSGIGFIGAGTILHGRGRVTGLTSAATLWVVAAIGIAVGAEAYVAAVGTTTLVMLALAVLRRVESALLRRRVHRRYAVTLEGAEGAVEEVERGLAALGLEVRLDDVKRRGGRTRATLRLTGPSDAQERVLRHLAGCPRVRSAKRA